MNNAVILLWKDSVRIVTFHTHRAKSCNSTVIWDGMAGMRSNFRTDPNSQLQSLQSFMWILGASEWGINIWSFSRSLSAIIWEVLTHCIEHYYNIIIDPKSWTIMNAWVMITLCWLCIANNVSQSWSGLNTAQCEGKQHCTVSGPRYHCCHFEELY